MIIPNKEEIQDLKILMPFESLKKEAEVKRLREKPATESYRMTILKFTDKKLPKLTKNE